MEKMRLYEMEAQLFELLQTVREMIWEDEKTNYTIEPRNVADLPSIIRTILDFEEKPLSLDEIKSKITFKNVPISILEEVLVSGMWEEQGLFFNFYNTEDDLWFYNKMNF